VCTNSSELCAHNYHNDRIYNGKIWPVDNHYITEDGSTLHSPLMTTLKILDKVAKRTSNFAAVKDKLLSGTT